MGPLLDSRGRLIRIDGLWSLIIGTGATGAAAGTLYFTAGPNNETDGLFGTLTPDETANPLKMMP
jgi:hypothetical protein